MTTVIVISKGDIDTFSSINAAEQWMEAIDLEHGEFEVFLADGTPVDLKIITESKKGLFTGMIRIRRVKARPRLDAKAEVEKLRSLLANFLGRVPDPPMNLGEASLSSLVEATCRWSAHK